MKRQFLLSFFLLNTLSPFAQISPQNEPFVRCLSFQMTGRKKNVNFFEGNQITLKTVMNRKISRFEIVKLTDSSFFYTPNENMNSVFDLQELKFKDIKKVYLRRSHKAISMVGFGTLGSAGIMLYTFDILNQLKNMPIKNNPTLLGVSAGLLGASYLIKLLTAQNYKINQRHYFHLYHLPYSSPLLKPNNE
jgi:hypothetical protein